MKSYFPFFKSSCHQFTRRLWVIGLCFISKAEWIWKKKFCVKIYFTYRLTLCCASAWYFDNLGIWRPRTYNTWISNISILVPLLWLFHSGSSLSFGIRLRALLEKSGSHRNRQNVHLAAPSWVALLSRKAVTIDVSCYMYDGEQKWRLYSILQWSIRPASRFGLTKTYISWGKHLSAP